jgi:hypothetical protein
MIDESWGYFQEYLCEKKYRIEEISHNNIISGLIIKKVIFKMKLV